MTRCNVCGKDVSTVYTVEEPRYFHGRGRMCTNCFERWAADDFKELDKRAKEKIK